jgi:hypothetical protein
MSSYKIISDRLTIGKQGQSIDADALDGANIQALIDGGHIAIVSAKQTSENTESKDK